MNKLWMLEVGVMTHLRKSFIKSKGGLIPRISLRFPHFISGPTIVTTRKCIISVYLREPLRPHETIVTYLVILSARSRVLDKKTILPCTVLSSSKVDGWMDGRFERIALSTTFLICCFLFRLAPNCHSSIHSILVVAARNTSPTEWVSEGVGISTFSSHR